MLLLILTLAMPIAINARPGSVDAAVSVQAGKAPVYFDGSNVGVDFLGYKASAGLGGLLSGDATAGGLHAEAGTPFGQAAGAGLGGHVDGAGKSAGGLYAGATAGGDIAAGAGIGGSKSAEGSVSSSFAGASSGGYETHITKVAHKTIAAPAPVLASKFKFSAVATPAVEHHKEIEVVAEEQPKPQTTYIQRTVIPNYVEKTIQVPSYVEKTIRVPTVVEKTVRVPAEPTVIEKTINAPADASAHVNIESSYVPQPHTEVVKVVQRTKVRPRHRINFFKHFGAGIGGGYSGGYSGGYGGGYGGGFGSGYSGSNEGSANYQATVRKTVNPQFINDIFNIPISTLGAVGKLVSGIAGGTSGSLSVSKSYSAGY